MVSEILSSFSLLFAALALIYSVWYKDIKNSIDQWAGELPAPELAKERKRYITAKKELLIYRLLPLMLGAMLISILMCIEVIGILINTLTSINQFGIKAIKYYDTVQMVLVLLCLFSITLSIHLYKLFTKLQKNISNAQK